LRVRSICHPFCPCSLGLPSTSLFSLLLLPRTLTDPVHSAEQSHSTLHLSHLRSLYGAGVVVLRTPFLALWAHAYAAKPALRRRRQALCNTGTTSTVSLTLPPARPRAWPPPLLDPERSFLPSRSPLSVCPERSHPYPCPSFSSRARPNPSACGQARTVFREGEVTTVQLV
jgi:hypothetical protein